jgi:autotransporter translocation and assembly factor TamB
LPHRFNYKINNNKVILEESTVIVSDKQLSMSGSLGWESGWDASIDGEWDISAFASQFEQLEQISGGLGIDLRISGELFEPKFSGKLFLRDGNLSFAIGNNIVGANSAFAELELAEDSARINKLVAQLGSGSVIGRGEVKNLTNSSLRKTSLEFVFDKAQIEPLENLAVSFGGSLQLNQEANSPWGISGEVLVKNAVYEEKVDIVSLANYLANFILGFEQKKATETVETSPVQLDLRILSDNDLVVDTDIAELELRGDLLVRGTPKDLKLDGVLKTLDGNIRLGSIVFSLVSGEIAFASKELGVDPRLAILAESEVKNELGDLQQIRMSVGGTLSLPKVRFSSDSGMTQNEIVSLFGLGGSGFKLLSAGKNKYSIRELIDPRSGARLSDRIIGIAGLKDVNVETGLSQYTGEFVPKVTITRPLSETLDLNFQSQLGGENTSKVGIDYPLSDYFKIVAEWVSRSVTASTDSTVGSYGIGFEYQKNFPGVDLVPDTGLKKEELLNLGDN